MVAAGVFNYFGRHLSYDLLKLVHGVGAMQSSIGDRLTLPIVSALVGVPGGLLRAKSPPCVEAQISGVSRLTLACVVSVRLLAILSGAETPFYAPSGGEPTYGAGRGPLGTP